MRLWFNPASPFARKVRIVARETGLEGRIEEVSIMRYENAVRPQALQWSDWVAGQFGKVRSGLDTLERESAGWGERFAIGEITAACVLGYLDFRFPDEKWRAAHPGLEHWFAKISLRPSVQATVPP